MLGMRSSPLTRLVLVAGLSLAAAAGVRAQDAARGTTLLGQAQQALGGASRLANVKTLQVTGTFRRVVGANDTDGDFEVFIELPDKYLRSEKTGTPGQPSTETIEGLVGTQVRDLVRGGGRGVGGGAIGGDGGAPAADAPPAADGGGDGPAAGANAAVAPAATAGGRGRGGVDPMAELRARQADVSRFLLMWLLRSDAAPLPWVGIAESPDGKADVLEARYADGQPTRLFLEAASHMPLMLQWQAAPARAGGAGRRGGGRGAAGQAGAPAPGAAPGAAAAGPAGPPQPVTFDMTFSDHREVNGIRLPHVITRGTNGMTTERWTITRYRVNPSIAAETFTR